MYKAIRKKVAATVSEIERTEDFAWGKWLKEPSVSEYEIEGFSTSLLDTAQYNSWLEKPTFRKKTFAFKDTFVFPEYKNLKLKKYKTSAVFFGLPKTELKKFKLFDNQFKLEHKPVKVEFTDFNLILKDILFGFGKIKVEIIPWELKPVVLKIDLLSNNYLTATDYSGKEHKVEFKPVKAPLKIYKVKFTNLDKIKLTKIYYLKNISLHDVRILSESLSRINSPQIKKEELKYFIVEEEKQEILREEPHVQNIVEEPAADINIEEPSVEENLIINEESLPEYNEVTDKSIEQQMSELLSGNISEEELFEPGIKEKPEVKTEEKILKEKEIKEDAPAQADDLSGKETEEETAELNKTIVEESEETSSEEDEEEADESKTNTEFEFVYYFQQEGAEFLLDTKRAVLHDELGLGKNIQAAVALKNLFINKNISNAVIVCDASEVGSFGTIPGDTDGWLGVLHQRVPELKAEAAKGTSQARNKQWKNPPDVLVISYDAFLFDLEENILNPKEQKKKTCFIIDEVQNLLGHKNFDRQKFIKSLNPKYLWLTSSYPEAEIKDSIDNAFKEKISVKNYFGRKRKDVANDLPPVTWENKWLTLDDAQVDEYNETFATAKEKVQWFLESGNPLRFNANVFTLIHQLKQVCNFSEKGKSKKTKLLLEQVKLIEKNNQQVIIFSQYEKAGTKKIEELLKKNDIKFLSYAPGLSTKEMSTVLKKFSSSPNITALVVGVKPSRVKIPSGNISYIINFDAWWNPASLWQVEDVITGTAKDGARLPLNIYTYVTKNTIEEKIHSLLHRKGFLNKHIMETVNPDSISEMITNPEWLEIFDMPDEGYKQRYRKGLLETEKRIDNYSLPDLKEKGVNLFTKLGYKNLDIIEGKSGDSFDIRGIFKRPNYDEQLCARFLTKSVTSSEEIKEHLAELKEITHKGKYFLISKGTFESEEVIKSNEALVDKNQLANYFYQFIIL